MSKPVKRNKKKGSSSKSQEKDATVEDQWTPLQLEQIELAKQLDLYIGNFQRKLLLLNFKPTERELIILFIMSLHPRWRRFIEPVELSFTTWLDAAKYARRHCRRVSAMLGCETDEQEAFFKTTESKALRDSGYFSPNFSLSENSSIQKLLIPAQQQKEIDQILQRVPIPSLNSAVSSAKSTPEVSKQNTAKVIPETSKQATTPEASKSSKAAPEASKPVKATPETSKPAKTSTESPKPTPETSKPTKSTPEKTAEQSNSQQDKAQEYLDKVLENAFRNELRNEIVSKYTEEIDLITKQIVKPGNEMVTSANGKDKEVLVPITRADNSVHVARIPVMREEDVIDGTNKILDTIPDEHKGVNLTFLELTVNGKKVRALLAKLRWGSSAISKECADRLGLPVRMSDDFCINTDFGYVDADGDMDLPIVHPADPKLKKMLRVCILPKIYGGKVDLVLGADFFFFFQPTLNIKQRTISFLGKETPYLVNQLK